jgi:hypothetical protein
MVRFNSIQFYQSQLRLPSLASCARASILSKTNHIHCLGASLRLTLGKGPGVYLGPVWLWGAWPPPPMPDTKACPHLSQPGAPSNYFSSLIEISASVILSQKCEKAETLSPARASLPSPQKKGGGTNQLLPRAGGFPRP